MVNIRVVARVLGILLTAEGILMLITAAIAYAMGDYSAGSLFLSAIISITTGVFIYNPAKTEEELFGFREGYIILTGTWIIFSLFGTLPFLLSGTVTSFTDAFFESVSGFTTTGATILTGLDSVPPGILLWRSLTQWMGGLGIIFLSMYILPVFKDSPLQLSTTEFSGQPADKIHPRWMDTAIRLISIYIILTLAETLFLVAGNMSLFEAVCVSLSTLSTGGFSPRDNSLTLLATPYNKIIVTLFMFVAGTNMTIFYFLLKGEFKRIREHSEFVFYLKLITAAILITGGLLFMQDKFSFSESILDSAFHVISVTTTTGFYTNDFNQWGNFVIIIFFVLMFTGGTAGSASGGIKIARVMILAHNLRKELTRLIHPDAFLPVRLNHKIIPQGIVYNVMVFAVIYILVVSLCSLIISLMGYDIITSIGTAAAMLGNIGPGIGELGPMHNYASVAPAGKWFLSFVMILGRLELLAIMVLFARSFYRK